MRHRLGVEVDDAIAKDLGITRQAVALARKRFGILPVHPRATPEQIAAIAELAGTLSDTDIAERVGLSATAVSFYRRRAVIPAFKRPVEIRHGLRSTYSHYGCRCDACTLANSLNMSEFRRKNPDKVAATKERRRKKVLASAPHKKGHAAWYGLGCRCDGCREATRKYQRDRYKKIKSMTPGEIAAARSRREAARKVVEERRAAEAAKVSP